MLKAKFLVLSLFSSSVFAACDSISCNGEIERIYATGNNDGRVLIMPKDDPEGVVDCSPAEGRNFTLKSDHPLFSEIYSMALSSLMAGKPVRMRIIQGTAGCELSYMWVTSS